MKERIINILAVFSTGAMICMFCFIKLVMLHHEQEEAKSFDTVATVVETETDAEAEEEVYDITLAPIEEETTTETHFDETTQNEYEIDGAIYTVTAYCGCVKCCGKTDGITATGTQATEGRTIAVDPSVIPYGTIVYINGQAFVAEDCGGAIKGRRIDMFFNTHEAALEWGVRQCTVTY